jgi:Mg/Co/Ni transporter MgtE
MIAAELISNNMIPLRTSDTGRAALNVMSDFYVKHLPVVNDKELLAIISENDVLNNPIDEPIGSFPLNINFPYVKQDDHLFEVMGLMAEHNLTVIPVVDHEKSYIGLISQEDLIQSYAKSFSFAEHGSIVVLEMLKSDYSLAEISGIVESESAAILATFLNTAPSSQSVFVTLKINKQEIQPILASFERYEYRIKATYTESDYIDTLRDRYNSLMNYLNV